MWQSAKVLNVFNTLTLIQIFWKTKTFFKKLEYCFLVESTKIENASFPYKTTISEVNVKTNGMVIVQSGSNFLKILFKFKNLLWESILYPNDPNAHIRTFCKRWTLSECGKMRTRITRNTDTFYAMEVLLDGAFSLWVSLRRLSKQLEIPHFRSR